MTFVIAELAAPKGGTLGICALPGRFGAALDDLAVLRAWRPDIVVSMTEIGEMERHNVADLGGLLAQSGIAWAHFPVRDFGTPAFGAAWGALSGQLHGVLDADGRVLAHCYGGHGRSGMVLMRLMVERGLQPKDALRALRRIRPGAVETDAQQLWASQLSVSRDTP